MTDVQSSTFGIQSTSYDADGKVTTVQEPPNGGTTSPATCTYTYYADGQRAQLSASGSALAQNIVLQYDYRPDGLRSKLGFSYGAQAASWSWTRTNAGRVTNLAYSSGQSAHTTTYDAQGRVASDTVPSGEMSALTYDDEGDVTGFAYPTGNTMSIGYTIRGEIATQLYNPTHTCTGSPDPQAPLYQKSANGYMVAYVPAACYPAMSPGVTWDARTGAGLSSQSSTTQPTGVGYAYDAAGRQISGEQDWSYTHQCGDQQCEKDGEGTQTRTYDAQNHLIREAISQWSSAGSGLNGCYSGGIMPLDLKSQTQAYAWGPNGHPDLWSKTIAGTTYPYTLHWDGNTPLFVTDSSGNLEEIKIEGLGYYAPSATHPMTFLDRDPSGFVVAAHWNGGSSAWQPENSNHQMCSTQDLSGYVLFEPGSDGISDGVNTIQGVRDFDPALATWTSPDAYAGDASDPMSRKSYMWNRNNSYAYSDPTGYDATEDEENRTFGIGLGGTGTPVYSDQAENAWIKEQAYAIKQEEGIDDPADTGAQKSVNKQVPKDWRETRNKLTKAIKRFKPGTKGSTHVRIMPGNPNDPNPLKQNPYVRAYSQGNALDANGNTVPKSQGVIPAGQFIFDKVFHE